jgi:hypothetical protein
MGHVGSEDTSVPRHKLNGPIGNDDYATILVTGLGVAQSVMVLTGVSSGLGHHGAIIDESHDQVTVKVCESPIVLESGCP